MQKSCKKGPYLVSNPCLYLYLKFLDVLGVILNKNKRKTAYTTSPKKILLVNWSHRGDVIIATSVLPLIKNAYPITKIGMLVGSWSKEIIYDHPLIDRVHIFDHPKINRNKQFIMKKIVHAVKEFYRLVKEIKNAQYDLAIDVYCYYPNSHFLTWQAEVPRRLGYSSGGGGSLLTDSLAWSYKPQHMSLCYLDLLKKLEIKAQKHSYLKSCLSSVPNELFAALQIRLELKKPYIIFHPYSGNSEKDWNEEGWKALINAFESSEYTIVFTGGSSKEREKIDRIIINKKNCVNLANRVFFSELKAIVLHAAALVCVDTMIGHLAAIYDIPTLVLFSKASDPNYWKPSSSCSEVFFIRKDDLEITKNILKKFKALKISSL